MGESLLDLEKGEHRSIIIRAADVKDAKSLVAIYNSYILETVITFEIEPITETDMLQRLSKVEATMPWLVAEDSSGAILGYAYATQWKARAAYDFAREVTVYLKPGFENLGYGTKLYRALISILQDSPIHSLIAGIAQPNAASVALHEKLGFKKVGEFEEVGLKFGRRVNIGYWQLLL
jgi:L-amino acid N-acyltransferase YncA